MGDCGCGAKKTPPTKTTSTTQPAGTKPAAPVQAPRRIDGIATKKTCPKCNYWMSLIISPSTKEKTFKCQNTLCKFSMPYSAPSLSQSV